MERKMSSIGPILCLGSLLLVLAPAARSQSSSDALKNMLAKGDGDKVVPRAVGNLAQAACKASSAVVAMLNGNEKEYLEDVRDAGRAYALAAKISRCILEN